MVNRCIREGKKIPITQRRHSKHPDAGTDIFRRHLALLARHEGNIETRWLCYDLFKSDVGDVRPGMKLSRKDNTKPWGPNNFEWMSSPNAMKVAHGKPIIIFGTTYLCIEDAAAHFGIATSTLKHRIYKQKSPPEESVTKPVIKNRKGMSDNSIYTYPMCDGEPRICLIYAVLSIKDKARTSGISF